MGAIRSRNESPVHCLIRRLTPPTPAGEVTTMDEWPVLLKVSEVAALLRVSRNLVYELIAQGELPVIRLGRVIRVPRDALERWIDREAATNVPNETDHAGALYSPNRMKPVT